MSTSEIDSSIEKLRAMLEPDGYDLVVAATTDNVIDLEVVAGDSACEDCLVPKAVFAEIVSMHIAPAGFTLGELAYPSEHGAGHD